MDLEKLTNVWLRKTIETKLIRIVEWAQRNEIMVEDITEENVKEALCEKDPKFVPLDECDLDI